MALQDYSTFLKTFQNKEIVNNLILYVGALEMFSLYLIPLQYYCRNSDPKFQEECKEIYLQRRKHYRLTGRYDTYHEKNEAMKEKLAERKKMKEEQRQQKLQEAQLHADTSLLGRFRNLFKS